MYFTLENISRSAFIALETIAVIENSANFETILGRFELLEGIKQQLLEFKDNSFYADGINKGLDHYYTVYHNKKPSELGLLIVNKPEIDSLNELFCVSVFNAFGRKFEKHVEEYGTLSNEKAKKNKKVKILEVLYSVRDLIETKKVNSPSSNAILSTVSQIEELIKNSGDYNELKLVKS
jgi:hypothetical protein